MKQLDYGKLIETEWAEQFSRLQVEQIQWGLKDGVDVSIYAITEFDYQQMRAIRFGLKAGLDVSIYAKPEYDASQMGEIQEGLAKGLEVSIYTNPEFTSFQMGEIRYGLEKGLDATHYANPAFEPELMQQIREGLREGVDVTHYANPEFNHRQMSEIRLGLGMNVDVSVYAKPEISWDNMRRARFEAVIDAHPTITVATFGKDGDKFQWFSDSAVDVRRKYAGWVLDKVLPVREDGQDLVPRDMIVDMMVAREASFKNRIPAWSNVISDLTLAIGAKELGEELNDLRGELIK